jgi:hypothetical protein
MSGEQNIGAKFEAQKKIETDAGASRERLDLRSERQEPAPDKKAEADIETASGALSAAASPVQSVISEYEKREKQIENFLARGLEDVYLGMPLAKQAEFRRTGEETAKKINKLLAGAKLNIGKIVALISKWLSIIPGVNRYFLEQEAKIKADEIMKLQSKN